MDWPTFPHTIPELLDMIATSYQEAIHVRPGSACARHHAAVIKECATRIAEWAYSEHTEAIEYTQK
jgi:hypothetical protein